MSETLTEFERLLAQARTEMLNGSAASVAIDDQPILNGVPYKAFRQSVSLSERRSAGTFFSGADLSREIASLLHDASPTAGLVLDPTCGMGDLLIAYASLLPIGRTLAETLEQWGLQIAGIDQREDLIAMAKARLVAMARARGCFRERMTTLDNVFPNIVVGDMFTSHETIAGAQGFLFNPPFGGTIDHTDPKWGAGKISAAALCLDFLVQNRHPAAPIAAILPEVLRCGSRYSRFRAHLAEAGIGGGFMSRDRFDRWTDVDVFTTLLMNVDAPLWASRGQADDTIGSRFIVRVGPVVPHRHDNKGRWQPYICAKSVPAWSDSFVPTANRRFKGTLFTPPFVVIRRTSSPSDRRRAVGAIIVGDRPVAVENHLVVALPKSGGLQSCIELLALLGSDETTNYLNAMIRCRHLTTGSIMSIPWQPA